MNDLNQVVSVVCNFCCQSIGDRELVRIVLSLGPLMMVGLFEWMEVKNIQSSYAIRVMGTLTANTKKSLRFWRMCMYNGVTREICQVMHMHQRPFFLIKEH